MTATRSMRVGVWWYSPRAVFSVGSRPVGRERREARQSESRRRDAADRRRGDNANLRKSAVVREENDQASRGEAAGASARREREKKRSSRDRPQRNSTCGARDKESGSARLAGRRSWFVSREGS